MAEAIFELDATTRTDIGKGASRRLRHSAKIPAVIYGTEQEAQSITLEERVVKKALEFEAFFSHILTVNVDGKAQKAVIKDIQRHPFKPKILHLDFLRISAKEKLQMAVPLHFMGEEEALGVKAGGIISHHMVTIEVACLPVDLPEYIEVDISHLDMDQALHLTEIKMPKGVELSVKPEDDEHDHPVASIHAPRAVKAEEEEEAEAEAPADAESSEKSDNAE